MKTKNSSKKVPNPISLRQSRQRTGQSFPLAPTLVAALLVAFCPAQVLADMVVFDTLGPGNTYNQTSGFLVVGSSVGLREAAAEFATDGDVNGPWRLDLGLTKVQNTSGGPVNVFLYGNAAGSPDNTDQTLLGSVTPTQFFGTTNNSLVSLTVMGVPLIGSLNQFIVLKPGAADTHDVWNDSTGPNSLFCCSGASADDVNWVMNSPGDVTQAFRITALGVPDSGGTLLIMLGSAAALFALQRVLRNERSS
jgi:hypothetical protein